jgi:hypothetical protein
LVPKAGITLSWPEPTFCRPLAITSANWSYVMRLSDSVSAGA